MSTQAHSRTDGWAVHRGDVRNRIVEAFMELLDGSSPMGLSMPAVAERAGISVRTLYRYFPTKDDLLRAAPYWLEQRSRAALGGRALDRDTSRVYLRTLWRDFADNLPAVLVQHSTRGGRELRGQRLPGAREQVDAILPPDVEEPRRREVVDLVVAVASSSMFLELADRMGRSPERAAEMAADLIELIITTGTGRSAGAQEGEHDGH